MPPPPQAHRDSSSQRYNTTNITWPLASQPVSRRQRQTRVIADELNELCTRPTTTNATSTPLTDPYQQPRHGDNDKSNESAGGGRKNASQNVLSYQKRGCILSQRSVIHVLRFLSVYPARILGSASFPRLQSTQLIGTVD